ncbi:hypothetical protein I545_6611 [Mycobacterium kansasii 662]|uniref:Uncharacterized protein n=2 Tax=Mycobacterium kansasii TaxID=1768 RepID=A0A1V3WRS0_MYCKA|nr:hypothetical protein I545_6611 [Mycobacterium kansasii 662]EUA04543.1 hypothetical protein I547_2085 [Mycobacterium kansasii 824]KEP44463.1 hypothetical protein MKSMC1_04350 [Mycobacterium kansasii]OOK68737.1 hypothetical protein BZL30_7007 [Mycobacterium kansasii]OOK69655.1 hypothetical protein BZL29_6162 [Mycobacterium kansasii]
MVLVHLMPQRTSDQTGQPNQVVGHLNRKAALASLREENG